ncbi:aspartate/glutamate racemase family protein [Sporomusa sphaeroides]|uniref:Aspartate racemase n=1 Tax=uncultured Sporomusa sp. TaxID=307249 RepID=A0A212LU78_9FIRM|nr:amino acid racemase [Sporomusa sphaeroides]SCM81093.1 Aspartate racemase [uncultured Sporomusa sp.]
MGGDNVLTVGILGGMGPMATVDLFAKIVECTPAACDQDHIKIIVYNNPQIPSRIEAILNGSRSPAGALIDSARFLENAGANLLVMPCNTAHYWYQDIQAAITIKLINMIENTANAVASRENSGDIVLFASAGTVQTALYQKAFLAKNISLLIPKPDEQQIISLAITAAKAGQLENNPYLGQLDEIMFAYQQAGANSFIGGCTEIPLLFKYSSRECCRIDPTRLLAQEVVRQALL